MLGPINGFIKQELLLASTNNNMGFTFIDFDQSTINCEQMDILQRTSTAFSKISFSKDIDSTQDGINLLVYGSFLTSRTRNNINATKQRFFFLDFEDSGKLTYLSQSKKGEDTYIDLNNVVNIFDLVNAEEEFQEIRVETTRRAFTFLFESKRQKKTILSGLKYLIFESCGKMIQEQIQHVNLGQQQALKQTDKLTFFESLMAEQQFKDYFTKLYQSYCDEPFMPMHIDQFRVFLREKQQLNMTLREVEEWIYYFGNKHSNYVSLKTFILFLMSKLTSPALKLTETIDHPMDYPLTDYFICSSHNTYLMGDQLVGDSSTVAYIEALEKGCRCVEIDCWDGSDGDPIVYHGHTLTSKIKFKAVIQTLVTYGFKHSQYPLIISLEVHCSYEQQGRMAEIMFQEFWDKPNPRFMVYRLPEDAESFEYYPSANSLKRCFILKNRGNYQNVLSRLYDSIPLRQQKLFSLQKSHSNIIEQLEGSIRGGVKTMSTIIEGKENDKKQENKSAHVTSKDNEKLEEIQAMFSASFSLDTTTRSVWQISSLDEDKTKQLAALSNTQMLNFHKKFFTRIYPSGQRVSSSNYDPFIAMSIGAQIVALNFQTMDNNLFAYLCLFQKNGKSGYILKPQYMRSNYSIDAHRGSLKTIKFTLKVIGGFNIHPESDESKHADNPILTISIRGHDVDQQNAPHKLKPVRQSGDLIVYDQKEMNFNIYFPELAVLLFDIEDEQNSLNPLHKNTQRCGRFGIPIDCLLQGFRVVPLRNSHFGIIQNSYLVVRIY